MQHSFSGNRLIWQMERAICCSAISQTERERQIEESGEGGVGARLDWSDLYAGIKACSRRERGVFNFRLNLKTHTVRVLAKYNDLFWKEPQRENADRCDLMIMSRHINRYCVRSMIVSVPQRHPRQCWSIFINMYKYICIQYIYIDAHMPVLFISVVITRSICTP